MSQECRLIFQIKRGKEVKTMIHLASAARNQSWCCQAARNQSIIKFQLFNSNKPIEELSKLVFSTTGTMQENWSMKCLTTSIAEMKKNERGSYLRKHNYDTLKWQFCCNLRSMKCLAMSIAEMKKNERGSYLGKHNYNALKWQFFCNLPQQSIGLHPI